MVVEKVGKSGDSLDTCFSSCMSSLKSALMLATKPRVGAPKHQARYKLGYPQVTLQLYLKL